jgi:cysteine desulfurase
LHVDAVGALGRVPLAVDECGIDLLTVSSNDLYGPPGAAALWVRGEIKLAPLTLGGAQEGGYRAGTENLPAIVGMGVAADFSRSEGPAEVARLTILRDRLLDGVLARVADSRLTGAPGAARLPHHVSLLTPGVKADAVLMELDFRGVSASSGSACASLTQQPSHVLRAIGCDGAVAESALCFTLGRWTTGPEIDVVLDVLPVIVSRLRRLAP